MKLNLYGRHRLDHPLASPKKNRSRWSTGGFHEVEEEPMAHEGR